MSYFISVRLERPLLYNNKENPALRWVCISPTRELCCMYTHTQIHLRFILEFPTNTCVSQRTSLYKKMWRSKGGEKKAWCCRVGKKSFFFFRLHLDNETVPPSSRLIIYRLSLWPAEAWRWCVMCFCFTSRLWKSAFYGQALWYVFRAIREEIYWLIMAGQVQRGERAHV